MDKQTFVLGDPHGGAKAIEQVFERSGFRPDKDKLICLGDVCDGWSEIPECFDILLEVDDLIYIWGNHDMWSFKGFYQPDFMDSDHGPLWTSQGGQATIDAYERVGQEKRDEHILDFLTKQAHLYYVDDLGNAYMHAGFDLGQPLEKQANEAEYYWNRQLFYRMHHDSEVKINTGLDIDKIFVGHTPTINHHRTTVPIKYMSLDNIEINFVDTGACYTGPLTLLNVETDEYFQSDPVQQLYPDEKGRNNYKYKNWY